MLREPLPQDLPRERFRVADALERGVRPHRLRALDLRAPHWGLRCTDEEPVTALDRCRQYAPLLAGDQCFSHTTAAVLWGLPVPLDVLHDETLHVMATGDGRAPRRPGVIGHRSRDVLILDHRGLPIVAPLRAWAQCAERFSLDDLVVMGDALLSKWSPHGPARYRSMRQLDELVTRWAGRRGAAKLAEALSMVRPRSWSPKETALRLAIVRAGCVEPPELNRRMYADDGGYLGRPDLAYESLGIGVEYEGDHHRTSTSTFRRDIARRERFADAGWRTLHVTELDLQRPAALAARFRRHLPLARAS
ncbi:hypothetical protein [Frondihabitans australicus]|uniref:DUF559 domain-containing protein n=1 Tax=Frondihabitans australicus TaxID=386892 RepID=A0A495IAT0_9MICO|nr:hypothetical protein [Frondihabitans australicus]RKR73114.1 hypothetical protein C8E83_0200 [Frondihabitans australicus]